MNMLTAQTKVVRSPHMVSVDMGGETVMMSIEKGAYFSVGSVGARIWALIEQPTSVAEICRQLCSEYEVQMPECQEAALIFLTELAHNGLISCE